MFGEEPFLFEEAIKWVTLDRLKLSYFYDKLNDYCKSTPDIVIGGILGLKNEFKMELTFKDMMYELYSKTPLEHSTDVIKLLKNDRCYIKLINGVPNLYVGKYLLVIFRYGEFNLREKFTCIYDKMLNSNIPNFENPLLFDLENRLLKTLESSPDYKSECLKKNRDCLWIDNTNIYITKDRIMAKDFYDEYGGELKEHKDKIVIKTKNKGFINVYFTAETTVFPMHEKKPHTLTSLYHLALEGRFGSIHRFRSFDESITGEYGYLDQKNNVTRYMF